jgi:hypothetical protein
MSKAKNTLTFKRERLANGKGDAFVGRATALLLPSGVQVVVMCETDYQLKQVCEELHESLKFDRTMVINGALANCKHVDFEEL